MKGVSHGGLISLYDFNCSCPTEASRGPSFLGLLTPVRPPPAAGTRGQCSDSLAVWGEGRLQCFFGEVSVSLSLVRETDTQTVRDAVSVHTPARLQILRRVAGSRVEFSRAL